MNKESPIRTIEFMVSNRASKTIIHSFAMFESSQICIAQISFLSNITIHQLASIFQGWSVLETDYFLTVTLDDFVENSV